MEGSTSKSSKSPKAKRKSRDYEKMARHHRLAEKLKAGSDKDVEAKVLELLFESFDEAEGFYIAYGREIGFDIREQITKKKSRVFVCNRHGFRKPVVNLFRKREPRAETRCGCKAKLRVAYVSPKCYKVTSFETHHNHDLAVGERAKFLKCNRYLSSADKSALNHLNSVGIKPTNSMDIIQSLVGDGKLPFLKKDGYNFLQKERRAMIENGDVNTAFNVLGGMKEHDPGFVLKHTTTVDGKLASLFWCDSQSQAEFAAFGDVLVLDSTYKTNTYRFPLAVFSGANNHGKNIIFGAGILCDEKAPSYRWILRTFKNAMDDKIPVSILTDQDPSILLAVKDVLPATRHRLCLWHLERNATQHVRNKGDFPQQFARLARYKCNIAEFEQLWTRLLDDYGVNNVPWVQTTYDNKEMWSEAYFEGVFLAGMRTTGRAESINALLKIYLTLKLAITQFISRFHQALQMQRSNFITQQIDTKMRKPVVRPESALYALEKNAAEICTRDIFKVVRKNISAEQALIPVNEVMTPNLSIFSYREFNKENQFTVQIDTSIGMFQCDCMLLESEGVPCPHIISCFKSLRFERFPDKSINSRWLIETGKNLRVLFPEPCSYQDLPCSAEHAQLYKEFINIKQLLSRDNHDLSKTIELFKEHGKKIEEESRARQSGKSKTSFSPNGKINISDPDKITSKGGDPKRLQHCSVCGNAGHNKVTCWKNKDTDGEEEAMAANVEEEDNIDI